MAVRRRAGAFWAVIAAVLFTAMSAVSAPGAGPQDAGPAASPSRAATLTDAEMERFLLEATITRTRSTRKGITASTQATLTDGTLTHDAHIQVIDEQQREFRTRTGIEWDFRDNWGYNIAAYKLDRLIGLNMVPVSVERRYRSSHAAYTWWVDDVMMDEGARQQKKLDPPPDKVRYWNQQIYLMRLFDELIYNTDRNMGNMLIGSDWRLWAIDHTRAFRTHKSLKNPALVTQCDRVVFAKLKALTMEKLEAELERWLDATRLQAILARRDLIVERLEGFGPAVLFDRTSTTSP